jgi:hypothetical protein
MEIDELPFTVKKDLPVGFLGEYAVVGDIHLGFEEDLNSKGYNVHSKTDELVRNILNIDRRKLILLGDIRSKFTRIMPSEGGVLMNILSRLSDKFEEVTITKGNHDGGLSVIADRLGNVRIVNEFILGNVGFMHGHALPTRAITSRVGTICFGHLHPSVIMRDKNGVYYRKDCWSIFDVSLPKSKYKNSKVESAVAFPKFNPYIGSTDETGGIGFMRYLKLRRRLSVDLVVV